MYFGSQYLEGEPRVVGWKLDARIPVIPAFIYVYCSWFALLAAVPTLLYAMGEGVVCIRYLIAYALDQTVSFLIFLLWPTTFTRPAPAGQGFTRFAFRTVYRCNHRFLNCVPSLHCSVALLFFFAVLAAPGLGLALRLGVGVLSLLIVASTVLVKQHVLIDVLTAIPTALLCWALAGLFNARSILAFWGL